MGFYNNTIIHPNLPPRPVLATGDTLNITVKNNVIMSLRNANLVILGGTPTLVAWDYNLYETPANFTQIFGLPPTYWSFTTWKSAHAGVDIHSTYYATGGSMLINTTTGVQSAGSPTIDSGVDLSGLGITALNSDALGNARGAGAGWDVGAFEFGAGVPTPSTPTGVHMASFVGSTFAIPIWAPCTDGCVGYLVYRSLVSGVYGTPIATITVASAAAAHSPMTQYIDSSLLTAGTGYYKIAAFDALNNVSALSSEVSITVTGKQ